MKAILSWMKLLLLLFLGIALALYLLQDQMIFLKPGIRAEQRRALANYSDQEYSLKVDGAILKGWLLEPQRSPADPVEDESIILYFGGNGEEVSNNIDFFLEHFNVPILLVNYRGYGDSSGKPSEKSLFADALALHDDLIKRKPGCKVIAMGRSVGSGVATYLASQRPCHKLVLITPFDSIEAVARGNFPFLPMSLLLKHKFRSDLYVKDLETPTLILGASADEVIPRIRTEKLIQSFTTPPLVDWIHGSGHNNISAFPKYWSQLSQFVNR